MFAPRHAWFFAFLSFGARVFCDDNSRPAESEDALRRLYEEGVAAYLANGFSECVEKLAEATGRYTAYKQRLVACRQRCAAESEHSEPFYSIDVDDLRFYEKTLKSTLCLIKCRNNDEVLSQTFTVSAETEKIFEERKPYEYLHNCYFQTGNYQRAASAAYTYLTASPDNEAIRNALKHYISMPEVKAAEIEDYEALDYVHLYTYGAHAYEQKDWDAAINNMEKSLEELLQAEEACRCQCEGPYSQGWSLDFTPSIANHFTHVLRCKKGCARKLSYINGNFYEDLLASHFNYLQYAYYKSGKLKDAALAVASYILFYPNDVTMKSNMEYYLKFPKVEKSYFTPRPEAVHYIHRKRYEDTILKFVETEFTLSNVLPSRSEKKTKELVAKKLLSMEKEAYTDGENTEITLPGSLL